MNGARIWTSLGASATCWSRYVGLASSEVFVERASVREIAKELVVTEAAVKQHLQHLYDKFGIPESEPRRRLVLAREALRRDAVPLSDTRSIIVRRGSGQPAPHTRYVDCDGVKIAWQVFGEEPAEILFVPGWVSNARVPAADRRRDRASPRPTPRSAWVAEDAVAEIRAERDGTRSRF